MSSVMGNPSNFGLDNHGVKNTLIQYWTLPTPALIERIVSRREGVLAREGAVVVRTGDYTGRAPNDKFIVQNGKETDHIWWGKVNQPITQENFDRLYMRMTAYFQGRDVFVQDAVAGADPTYSLPIRIITEQAWHSLFARNLFIRINSEKSAEHIPQYTILHAPGFRATPEIDGTNSEIFIILNVTRRLILIGGTSYAGEIKKSIFTVMNYILPLQGVLSMHCSANVGQNDDVSLFFGLSGTGKTTLSSDLDRFLIGDDEHGWSDSGVFNIEGGCYAKTIHLRQDLEPLIWSATKRFGAILENVNILCDTREIDFEDQTFTENTRAAYPISFVPNSIPEGRAGHPNHIFFLTADAFGVLPPISRLSPEQAMYHYLSGYTSKLAGTEKGVGSEPQTTFSACFGAPFLPLHPKEYARLLGEKIKQHNTNVWLVNTGWTGGPYGVGERIRLPYTRAMVSAAINGELENVMYRTHPLFGLRMPEQVPGVPADVLDPKLTWKSEDTYDEHALKLAARFVQNFEQFKNEVSPEIAAAGPGQTA